MTGLIRTDLDFLKKLKNNDFELSAQTIISKPTDYMESIKGYLRKKSSDTDSIDNIANELFDEMLSHVIKKSFLEYIKLNLLPFYKDFDFLRKKNMFSEEQLHRLFMEYSLDEKVDICNIMNIRFKTEEEQKVFLFIADVAYSKLLSSK